MCLQRRYKIKDMSHLQSPVQAARFLHTIPNYDRTVGKFTFDNDIYILQNGYYILINN